MTVPKLVLVTFPDAEDEPRLVDCWINRAPRVGDDLDGYAAVTGYTVTRCKAVIGRPHQYEVWVAARSDERA